MVKQTTKDSKQDVEFNLLTKIKVLVNLSYNLSPSPWENNNKNISGRPPGRRRIEFGMHEEAVRESGAVGRGAWAVGPATGPAVRSCVGRGEGEDREKESRRRTLPKITSLGRGNDKNYVKNTFFNR